jgi:hypothetical protein
MRHLKIRHLVVTTLLSLGVATAAKANVVIGDFGTGFDGWSEVNNSGSYYPLTSFGANNVTDNTGNIYSWGNSIGATLTGSLEQTQPGTGSYETDLGFDILANGDASLFESSTAINIDWTASANTNDTTSGYQHLVNVVLNSQNGGYQNLGTASLTTQYYYSGGPSSPVTVYGVTVSDAAYMASIPSGPGGWFQMAITTQAGGGAPVNMYFDNVNLTVPEPASLGLLGASAVGLLIRRRRHSC